jgi:pimeloyl-ACP methyl ester carboxylesterase
MSTTNDFPGAVGRWNGFVRHDFTFNGWQAILVEPETPAAGMPWIWRARFFDAWPAVDLALLAKGFHLAYVDVADLFGSPKACARFDAYYSWLVEEQGLATKVVLEGFSRGGLAVYNWAARNPEKVCCIYADAPVCDFKSWPAGKGLAPGSPESWSKCLDAYGLTEEEALDYPGNPIDNLQPLAKAGIPAIHVCGDADEVVPVAENTDVLAQRYRALGGQIEVIQKPGVGHHPHSLENPAPVVDFILQAFVRTEIPRERHFGSAPDEV